MAQQPRANVYQATQGAGVGRGTELLAIFSCTEKGPLNAPRLMSRVQECLDVFGYSEGLELAAHHVQITKRPFLFVRMPTAVAGAIGPVDTSGVEGTSVITFTGTPLDDEFIVVRVPEGGGGTIGTDNITIEVSRDGGVSFKTIRLGTGNSYAIPRTGITVNFAAGDLEDGDEATARCTSPRYDADGLAAARAALAAQSQMPRLIHVCGDVDSSTDVQDLIDEIEAYETENQRHCRIICNARDRYADAVMQGGALVTDIDFDAVGHTITITGGNFLTSGFKIGQIVTVAGSTSNNGELGALTNVTSTVLTFASGVIAETNKTGAAVSITATEPASTWRAALNTIVGTSPATAKVSHRVSLFGGRARRKSPIDGARRRRPASWPVAIRVIQRDLAISAAKMELGGLDGWTLHDENGELEDHDERVDGGLLAIRIGCLTTSDDLPGIYCALPLTLDEDNAPLSRLPVGLVCDLACRVAKRETTRQLGSGLLTQIGTGFILESEAKAVEEIVLTQLKSSLLTGPEGPRATDVTFSMARDVNLLTPGAEVPCEVEVTPLGYLEAISTTVRVATGG